MIEHNDTLLIQKHIFIGIIVSLFQLIYTTIHWIGFYFHSYFAVYNKLNVECSLCSEASSIFLQDVNDTQCVFNNSAVTNTPHIGRGFQYRMHLVSSCICVSEARWPNVGRVEQFKVCNRLFVNAFHHYCYYMCYWYYSLQFRHMLAGDTYYSLTPDLTPTWRGYVVSCMYCCMSCMPMFVMY
jgi:hypothetical protein